MEKGSNKSTPQKDRDLQIYEEKSFIDDNPNLLERDDYEDIDTYNSNDEKDKEQIKKMEDSDDEVQYLMCLPINVENPNKYKRGSYEFNICFIVVEKTF